MKQEFTNIYLEKKWSGESHSGPGSGKEQSGIIGRLLAEWIRSCEAHTVLDAGCGDFNWLRHVILPVRRYYGIDIVSEMIGKNVQQFGTASREFRVADISRDELPKVDMIICRDVLMHVPLQFAVDALANFRKTGAKWLAATTFSPFRANKNINPGEWFPVNMRASPFDLPNPLRVIDDWWPNADWKEKIIGLWEIN